MSKPGIFLKIEAVAILTAACVLFHRSTTGWGWFALLFLAPDLSMLGYFLNKKLGALCYNFAHTYATPLALLGILWLDGRSSLAWLAIIWIAHIGFDRVMGYGLKYDTAFKDTHLQRV